MRAAANRPATLRYHLVDEAGSPLTEDNGTKVTVTVAAGDGITTLYSNQIATYNATDGGWEWVLPPQTKLDQLTAAWTATVGGVTWTVTTVVDVVAERLVEPWLARQDPDLSSLTAANFLLLMDKCEDYIEGVLGFPPVLAGVRPMWDTLRGTLNDALYVSGTVNGLPYGWGAGKMLIPGVKFPVVGSVTSSGNVTLATTITSGTVSSIDLEGDTRSLISGAGFVIELSTGYDAVTAGVGSYAGGVTTYAINPVAVVETYSAGVTLSYTGPYQGQGAIYSGSINGVALDPVADIAKLKTINGCLVWSDYRPWISGRYELWLTHGEPDPPRDLRDACLKMMKHYAGIGANNNYPDRTASVTTEGATILFNLPGPDRPTGLPEVDSVLQRIRLSAVI